MAKIIKTYGVSGLMQWHAIIPIGRTGGKLHVNFVDGALTAYGTTPAEYTTDNPLVQRIIEDSAFFKEGRIQLLRTTVEEGLGDNVAEHSTGEAVAEQTTGDGVAEHSTGEAGEVLEEVAVSCLDDAREWLVDKHGVSKSKLRSKAQIESEAKAVGVAFVFE